MKSLLSIIGKLSNHEIELFRQTLLNNNRRGKNKKLELFDRLRTHYGKCEEEDIYKGVSKKSRQSVYQLKKRLQDDLYSFLLSQPQAKTDNEQMFLEMDCHRKLYCFKMLIDRGIEQHALEVLDEVLSLAAEHQMHSIYLEAVNLKNTYFPLLNNDGLLQKYNVNLQIQNLQKSIHQNFYINQYLSESASVLHDSDEHFRSDLIDHTHTRLPHPSSGVEDLKEVNKLFYKRDFVAAHEKLLEIEKNQNSGPLGVDTKLRGLICVELVKSCICLGYIAEARRWFEEAEYTLRGTDAFRYILLELNYVLELRSFSLSSSTLSKGLTVEAGLEGEALEKRWFVFKAFTHFQLGEYKRVIKLANSNLNFSVKNKGWLIMLKMLELWSIYQLDDRDWLFYKVESLRKLIGKAGPNYVRLRQILALMKSYFTGGPSSAADVEEGISRIEKKYPWHPLSSELINFSSYLHRVSSELVV